MTLARGEAAPGRGNRGGDASWTDENLIRLKDKEIQLIDSTAINGR
jgi:hypothetical protein